MKKKLLFLLFIILPFFFFAQENSQAIIESFIEELSSNLDEDEEVDFQELYDDLDYFYNNPLNINFAEETELQKFKILTNFQVKSLIKYIRYKGQLISIYELQLVEGFDVNLVKKLQPFIAIKKIKNSNNYKLKYILKYGKNSLMYRMQRVVEEQKGYTEKEEGGSENSRYLGSPWKNYFKYKFNYGRKISFGLVGEKDAGEEFFTGSQKKTGFDYYSCHLQVDDISIFKRIIVGDFRVQTGHGLILWNGMGFGKSAYTMNINKRPQYLKKYSSTDENNFFRGAGTTVNYKDLYITTFYSRKKIDGNLTENKDSLEDFEQIATSFQNSGFHATPSELEDKDAVKETVYGASLSLIKNKYRLGFNYLNYAFDNKLEAGTALYEKYYFSGDRNFNYSADYQVFLNKINFFGEIASDKNNAIAMLNGMLVEAHSQLYFGLLHRRYDKDYNAMYSGSFSENTRTQNENGWYLSTEFHPIKNFKISAYYDIFKFNWLRYRTNAPSDGFDYIVHIDYTPSYRLQMYLRLKQKNKAINSYEENPVSTIENYNKINLRYNLQYIVNDQLSLKSRFEYAHYDQKSKGKSVGYLILQDVNYKFKKIPLKLNFRYAIYDTDDWDSRIYAYENDILYAFSIPAYYSKGIRTYLNLNYKLFRNFDVWFKYAINVYRDKKYIGSDKTYIDGNKKSEIKLQCRYKF